MMMWCTLVASILFLGRTPTTASPSCIPTNLTDDFWTFLEYKSKTSQFFVNFSKIALGVTECMAQSNLTYFFELVTDNNKIEANKERSCTRLKEKMKIEQQPIIYKSNITRSAFQYVTGQYFLRIKECEDSACVDYEDCDEENDRCWCSQTKKFGARSNDTCSSSKKEAKGTPILRPGNTSMETLQCETSELQTCNLTFVASVPMCVKIQNYSEVKVSIIKRSLDTNGENISFSELDMAVDSGIIPITRYRTLCRDKVSDCHHGFVHYNKSKELPSNASYVFVIQLLMPNCYRKNNKNCYFVLEPAPCYPNSTPCINYTMNLWVKPVIFGAIFGLVASFGVLFAIMFWCKRTWNPQNQGSDIPLQNSQQLRIETVPLQMQDIVLIYFPDNEKFKELNTKFRDWISSLSFVKEAIDVNEDKYSEGMDGYTRNPEGWVANILGDGSKKVILVTSQLAYQCLTNLRKGVPPPRFPSPNPLDDLLVHMLRFIDSEMFKANYRRLSCVRYSKVSVCDDQFGAGAVNIVPGTEYLFPEHLDELAGWINPQQFEIDDDDGIENWAKRKYFFSAIDDYRQLENVKNCGIYTKI